MHKFVQSFVLAPQSAKKYYVHIDIFRYQDTGPLTNDLDSQPSEQCFEGNSHCQVLLTSNVTWLL